MKAPQTIASSILPAGAFLGAAAFAGVITQGARNEPLESGVAGGLMAGILLAAGTAIVSDAWRQAGAVAAAMGLAALYGADRLAR